MIPALRKRGGGHEIRILLIKNTTKKMRRGSKTSRLMNVVDTLRLRLKLVRLEAVR